MKTVIIEVRSGVAYVKEIPEGITVIVRDFDNADYCDDMGTIDEPAVKQNEDGERYFEEVSSNPSAF